MQSTHNTHSTAPVLQHRDKYLDSDRVDGAADLKTSLLEHHDRRVVNTCAYTAATDSAPATVTVAASTYIHTYTVVPFLRYSKN